MRSLLIVAALSAPASADVTRAQLAEALAKGDVATLDAAAQFPVTAFGVWFDAEPCLKFSSRKGVRIAREDFPAFVKCFTALGAKVHDADAGLLHYGAGTPVVVVISMTTGAPRLRAFGGSSHAGYIDRDDAAPIDAKLFTSKIAAFSREVAPPPKDKTRLDASTTETATARVRLCVDKSGKPDSIEVDQVGQDIPAYGDHVKRIAAGWKTAPFLIRGKPTRACARFPVGYPASRMDRLELSLAPPPPPPPSYGESGNAPQNVPPTLLEGSRISGEKNIVPDDDTKTKMLDDGKAKVIGSWKLCLADTGAISRITRIKATGYDAYDKKIEAEMAKWRYRPYLVNGKAVPVCTAITFIYTQK